MKKHIITYYILTFFLVGCISAQEKNELIINEIDFIEIHKNESGMKNPTYKLTSEQVNDFTRKWNDSESTGVCKYWSYYNITVHVKTGIPRSFRTNNKSIKEDSDLCFDVGSENYFEGIWNTLDK